MGLKVVLLVGLLFGIAASHVRADHNGPWLPLIPNTPAIQNMIRDGDIKWCADDRATNYPSFISQVNDVDAAYASEFGVTFTQVGFDSSCELKHVMPDVHGCGASCAAWIFYANWPAQIEYKWQLGYVDWRSTIGHEMGHLFGLHEMYKDSGSIGCDSGYQAMVNRLGFDTVMSCGTLVRYPTQRDQDRIGEKLWPKPKQWAWPFYDALGFGVYWSPEQSDVGTRVAITTWNCVTGETKWLTTVPASARFAAVPFIPNTYYYTIFQNATQTSLSGENGSTIVGAMSCP